MPSSIEFSELANSSFEYAAQHNFFLCPVVSSELLKPLIDYQIAQDVDPNYFIYFGSQNNKGLFPRLVDDVLERGTESPYYGNVICTLTGKINRDNDGGDWSYYKNIAFWAGGIDAHRAFYLLTDIAWYYNRGKPNPQSGTCQEILWLLDNGYRAIPDLSNPKCTIFLPSSNPGILSIFNNSDDDGNNSKRLASFIRSILSSRRSNIFLGNCEYKHPVPLPNVLSELSEVQNSNRFFQNSDVPVEPNTGQLLISP